MPGVVKKELTGFVGFSNLPHQVHRHSFKKGFEFTLMVVGESGLGKSTFVNNLFATNIYPPKDHNTGMGSELKHKVEIKSFSTTIEENSVHLKVNVLDASGFGDHINNENSWEPILSCIESRYDSYLEQEQKVNRSNMEDSRVHCCLYFISPTGHNLKPLDIELMKKLDKKVCLIPVIAKSDTLTESECAAFKKRVIDDIVHHQIDIFRIDEIFETDEEEKEENKKLQEKLPFAVVSSSEKIDVDGKSVFARSYPWGIIEVENENHCDFVSLRKLLIRAHMEDLRERTTKVLYENYRVEKMLSKGIKSMSIAEEDEDPNAVYEQKKKYYEGKLVKDKESYKQLFESRVRDKENSMNEADKKSSADFKAKCDAKIKERDDLLEKKRTLESQKTDKVSSKKKKSSIFG